MADGAFFTTLRDNAHIRISLNFGERYNGVIVTTKERKTMDTTVDAPLRWVESITMLRLPEQADQRLQNLMDRNSEGQLSDSERADLWLVRKKMPPRRRNFRRFPNEKRRTSSIPTNVNANRCVTSERPRAVTPERAIGENAVRHGDSWMVAANGRSGHGCSRNAGHGWPECRPSVASRPPKHEGIPSGTEATGRSGEP